MSMWPFTKPKPKPPENVITLNAAKFAKMGRILREERANLDAEFASRQKAEGHKQWCQSIYRQAKKIGRLKQGAISAFEVGCQPDMRKAGYHDWLMRSAIGQQVESQRLTKRLRRTLKRYGIDLRGCSQWQLKRRFVDKVWIEQEGHTNKRAAAEKPYQIKDTDTP